MFLYIKMNSVEEIIFDKIMIRISVNNNALRTLALAVEEDQVEGRPNQLVHFP